MNDYFLKIISNYWPNNRVSLIFNLLAIYGQGTSKNAYFLKKKVFSLDYTSRRMIWNCVHLNLCFASYSPLLILVRLSHLQRLSKKKRRLVGGWARFDCKKESDEHTNKLYPHNNIHSHLTILTSYIPTIIYIHSLTIHDVGHKIFNITALYKMNWWKTNCNHKDNYHTRILALNLHLHFFS